MPTPAKKSKPQAPTHREPVSIALGKRLKELRIKADRSQAELAFDCELDRTYISLIERGLANPSLWTLGTLAFALETTVPDLLRGNKHVVKPSMGEESRKRRVNQASHEPKLPVVSRRSQLR
ncbi:helix-turn-helix domain-containing protein [Variovorax sp. 38R]|uniref:helix-turn-helix domain-containing protein n=1 Tax=Variovorax sp. 38R TaxID=2774875 RepID=UPI00178165D7|nr:helix-turn-helix transcriptional regulator [Variovorax sp. 38R]QOF76170.1 helix-turn-helix transcriptional regulator [Variovorax sp. 38R]